MCSYDRCWQELVCSLDKDFAIGNMVLRNDILSGSIQTRSAHSESTYMCGNWAKKKTKKTFPPQLMPRAWVHKQMDKEPFQTTWKRASHAVKGSARAWSAPGHHEKQAQNLAFVSVVGLYHCRQGGSDMIDSILRSNRIPLFPKWSLLQTLAASNNT